MSNSSEAELAKVTQKLQDLGYDFNEKGELRQFDNATKTLTDKCFEFVVKKDDHKFNQEQYEKLGEVLTDYVYCLLEVKGNLRRLRLAKGSFIFASQDLETNDSKLLLLIHGMGVVRAGQWSRRLIINDNLECGTQLPYIKKAIDSGYSVVVMNTNHNFDENGCPIEGSETAEAHAFTVWKEAVHKSPAANIAIVAHSYGGVVVSFLAQEFFDDFQNKVFAVMFTDSIKILRPGESRTTEFLSKVSLNYVAVDEPLGTHLETADAVQTVSAGHTIHEWTSHSAFSHLFETIEKKLLQRS